jgi:septal ring factor EnvC (AmiA/AmiB activator)
MKLKRSGQEKQNRTRHLRLVLTPAEYELITTRWHKTTCRGLSEYLRKIMFGKPVIVRHRNQSLDDLMGTLILLRCELNLVVQNHHQVVKQLNQLREGASIENWLREHETAWETINQKITEIKAAINKIDDEWLQ